MIRVLYPGTFDPITNGHLDIICRVSKMYDEVIVAVMENPRKKCSFSAEERKELIEKCVRAEGLKNVVVTIGHGLTIQYAEEMECKAIIRGIRAVADYEYELSLATSNMSLNSNIETVLLIAQPKYSFLSSSIAKEVAHFGGDVSPFIPPTVQKDVINRLKDE